jgi:hypothetical protein
MKMKKTSMLVLGLALVIALIPVSSYAQSTTEEPVSEEGCTMAKAKIATHTTAASAAQTEHIKKYAGLKDTMDTLVSSATIAKYSDVATLTAARDKLAIAIDTYTSTAKTYSTTLEKIQTSVCGEEAGQFTDVLATARTELTVVRNSSLAVKTSVAQSAVPALRDYASWLKANIDTAQEKS